MKLSWCGALASGKLKSYRVDQSTNGGSSYKTLLKATKSTSSTRSLGTSTRYRWRAQTTDTRARKGSYRTSLVSRLARVEDTQLVGRVRGLVAHALDLERVRRHGALHDHGRRLARR